MEKGKVTDERALSRSSIEDIEKYFANSIMTVQPLNKEGAPRKFLLKCAELLNMQIPKHTRTDKIRQMCLEKLLTINKEFKEALDIKYDEKSNVVGEMKIGNEIIEFELEANSSNTQHHSDSQLAQT